MIGTDKARRRITIEVSKEGNDAIQVIISDTGKGLGSDDIDKVFDPFYTTKSSGLGIGLSISRTIVESHGGRIWAQCNPEGGATFRFTLPIEGEA